MEISLFRAQRSYGEICRGSGLRGSVTKRATRSMQEKLKGMERPKRHIKHME